MAETIAGQISLEGLMEPSSSQPMVSIVIPVFNGSDYLAEAIDSALAQTYLPLEVVVVNDGSMDDGKTERIALSYGTRIRYFSKSNGGVASALNFAIGQMRGDYFSWLSHDDLYVPDKVARQVEVLQGQASPDTIVYGDAVVFTDDPNVTEPIRISHVEPEQFRCFLTMENGLHGCTLLIPKLAFDECGSFDESLRTTQDYDMWFRMAGRFRFVHLPHLAVKARRHGAQGSVTMKDTALAECNRLLAGFADELTVTELTGETHKLPSIAYVDLAGNFEQRGFHLAARHTLCLAKGRIRGENLLRDLVARATLSCTILVLKTQWSFRELKKSARKSARRLKALLVSKVW
jgi:glycosyltransferase involved in cell wall biosynthesis